MINVVVTKDAFGGLSQGGVVPWTILEDLSLFRKLTIQNVCVMGRRKFESILELDGQPLEHRTSVVLTNQLDLRLVYDYPNVHFMTSQEFFRSNFYTERFKNPLWVIGGASMYSKFIPLMNKLYTTDIYGNGHCDTFMPVINRDLRLVSMRRETLHEMKSHLNLITVFSEYMVL